MPSPLQLNIDAPQFEGRTIETGKPATTPPGGDSFLKTLEESIKNVDKLLNVADEKMEALATGKGENIHEAMIAFEKAEAAMKLLVQVRNKALDAYTQIMQMQV